MLIEVATVVTFNPWAASPDSQITDLLPLLPSLDGGEWPVVDVDRKVIGTCTELAVLSALGESDAGATTLKNGKRTIGDIMQPAPDLVEQTIPAEKAIRRLLGYRTLSLPVVDDQRLVGVVSAFDLMRELSYSDSPIGRNQASGACEGHVECVDVDLGLSAVLRRVADLGVGYIGVTRGDLPMGVFSRKEIETTRARALCRSAGFDVTGATTLAELVADAPMVAPGRKIREVAALLAENNSDVCAVVNQAGRLLGGVSVSGILRKIVE